MSSQPHPNERRCPSCGVACPSNASSCPSCGAPLLTVPLPGQGDHTASAAAQPRSAEAQPAYASSFAVQSGDVHPGDAHVDSAPDDTALDESVLDESALDIPPLDGFIPLLHPSPEAVATTAPEQTAASQPSIPPVPLPAPQLQPQPTPQPLAMQTTTPTPVAEETQPAGAVGDDLSVTGNIAPLPPFDASGTMHAAATGAGSATSVMPPAIAPTMPATPAAPAAMPVSIPPAAGEPTSAEDTGEFDALSSMSDFADRNGGAGANVDDPADGPAGFNPRVFAAIIGAILAIILVLGGTLWWWMASNHARALSDCRSAYDALTSATAKADDAVAAAQDTAGLDSSSVADSATLDTLNNAIKEPDSLKNVIECDGSADTSAISQATQSIRRATNDQNSRIKAIASAVSSVDKSQERKTIEDEQTTLSAKRDAAQSLFDSSNGKVADEDTRTALQEAIVQASALINDSTADSQTALQQASDRLDDAMKAVNASVKKKTDDEKKAKEDAKKAADKNHCAALTGDYVQLNGTMRVVLRADCSYDLYVNGDLYGSYPYEANSYKDLGNTSFSWYDGEDTLAYIPPGQSTSEIDSSSGSDKASDINRQKITSTTGGTFIKQ